MYDANPSFDNWRIDLAALKVQANLFSSISTVKKTVPDSLNFPTSILFSTYAELYSKGERNSSRTRFQELCNWLGSPKTFDGIIVFDECHRAKNSVGDEKKKSSTAKHVIELQTTFPLARIVYASATGIALIENMGYLCRLGLWGKGTAFKNAEDFVENVKGINILELLSLDLKACGLRVARHIGFHGVEFDTLNMFHVYAKLWHNVYQEMEHAEEVANKNASKFNHEAYVGKTWKGTFYQAQQIFFRQ